MGLGNVSPWEWGLGSSGKQVENSHTWVVSTHKPCYSAEFAYSNSQAQTHTWSWFQPHAILRQCLPLSARSEFIYRAGLNISCSGVMQTCQPTQCEMLSSDWLGGSEVMSDDYCWIPWKHVNWRSYVRDNVQSVAHYHRINWHRLIRTLMWSIDVLCHPEEIY